MNFSLSLLTQLEKISYLQSMNTFSPVGIGMIVIVLILIILVIVGIVKTMSKK